MKEKNINKSIFVEYLGESPRIKILDFLIQGLDFDYNMTEVARGAGVGWSVFTNVWENLLDKKIIVHTKTIGNTKLFRLNRENLFAKKLIQFDWDLTKLEMDKIINKS